MLQSVAWQCQKLQQTGSTIRAARSTHIDFVEDKDLKPDFLAGRLRDAPNHASHVQLSTAFTRRTRDRHSLHQPEVSVSWHESGSELVSNLLCALEAASCIASRPKALSGVQHSMEHHHTPMIQASGVSDKSIDRR